jgi:uncharacterized membrane protein
MKSLKMRRVIFRYTWDRMRVSLWFVPLVMSFLALLFALFMHWLDVQVPNESLHYSPMILSGDTESLRGALISITTTILATAGVVFSLLTLPLSTVASQYGSRLLRVFLRDRTTQFVLGMFVFTFVYCLAAVISIPPNGEGVESPLLSVTLGVFLMMATFASLILLIQHISTMLQAPNIAAAAGRELLDVIHAESGYDFKITGEGNQKKLDKAGKLEEQGFQVHLNGLGYIKFIDLDYLLSYAQEKDYVIRILHQSGHFIEQNTAVAIVWPAERVDASVVKRIRRGFIVGNQRTPTQDIEYAINQLVEVADRAMSPGINDPFTAMTCLDYLGIGLVSFIQNYAQIENIYDRNGILRILLQPLNINDMLDAAFNMLRHASCDNASVLLHIIKTIDEIGEGSESPVLQRELMRHVNLVQEESLVGSLIDADKKLIQTMGETVKLKYTGVL